VYNTEIDTRSLYIHWPFCPYRCHFCPFVALASHDSFMPRYHAALSEEIKTYAAKIGRTSPLKTIYMGGGTPSTYPDTLLLDMSGILKDMFIITKDTEFTIEVNPGTVRVEQFDFWRSIGINRMSVGVQSLSDKVLHSLNRMHSIKDVYFLLEHAQHAFDNISVDLILGLPGVTENDWKAYIREVVTWPIKHVSMYFLQVHEKTPLYFRVKSNELSLPKDDSIVDLYHWSRDYFRAHGFAQYEVSNFAKSGYESRHNTVYWEREPYKAFGIGACSFDGSLRFQNEKNLLKYLAGVEQGKDVTVFSEQLTEKQVRLEKIMLGLRRAKGVLLDTVIQGLDSSEIEQVTDQLLSLRNSKLIEEVDGYLILTTQGLVVENEIVTRLLS
jgi:oxygen-independent coproporphyrinogen-3 oxidase